MGRWIRIDVMCQNKCIDLAGWLVGTRQAWLLSCVSSSSSPFFAASSVRSHASKSDEYIPKRKTIVDDFSCVWNQFCCLLLTVSQCYVYLYSIVSGAFFINASGRRKRTIGTKQSKTRRYLADAVAALLIYCAPNWHFIVSFQSISGCSCYLFIFIFFPFFLHRCAHFSSPFNTVLMLDFFCLVRVRLLLDTCQIH